MFTVKSLRLMASKVVLAEVERNVRAKLRSHHLERFFRLVDKLEIVSGLPEKRLVNQAERVIAEKDAVILAEAKRVGVDYIVSLDKRDFLTNKVREWLKPQRVVTPKMILEGEV